MYALKIEPQGHPINALLELLGRRWTLRILWELRDGPLPYRRLREASGNVSTSVLSQRLRELTGAGILEQAEGAYGLTPRGRELSRLLLALNDWAKEA